MSSAPPPSAGGANLQAFIKDVQVVKRDEVLKYQVLSNSNSNLVTATIENNVLVDNDCTGTNDGDGLYHDVGGTLTLRAIALAALVNSHLFTLGLGARLAALVLVARG
mgnify:CR=1 FL=1